jgi:hypothetical protein
MPLFSAGVRLRSDMPYSASEFDQLDQTAGNNADRVCAVVKPVLWTNPWARVPLPTDALPWRRNEIQLDGTTITHDAIAPPAAVLRLHPLWPATR